MRRHAPHVSHEREIDQTVRCLPWRLSRARLHAGRPRAGHSGGQPRAATTSRVATTTARRRRLFRISSSIWHARAPVRDELFEELVTDGRRAGKARQIRLSTSAETSPCRSAVPRRAHPPRTAGRAPAARVFRSWCGRSLRALPARAGAGRQYVDVSGGGIREIACFRRHARDIPGAETSSLRRDDRDARRGSASPRSFSRGLPLVARTTSRSTRSLLGGRSRVSHYYDEHPCHRAPAVAIIITDAPGVPIALCGELQGARRHAATTPARLPARSAWPGADPGARKELIRGVRLGERRVTPAAAH